MFIEIHTDNAYETINPHRIERITSQSRDSGRCEIILSSGETIDMALPIDKMVHTWKASLREWFIDSDIYSNRT